MAAVSMTRSMSAHMAVLAFAGLRCTSALGALVNGFALTYTFARILEPSLFALFMWVGNLGISLWLFDLGLTRVLYVQLRDRHLSRSLKDDRASRLQATSVVALYMVVVMLGTVAALVLGRHTGRGTAVGLFFAFCALNLPWYALRQIAGAVDRFMAFEGLEATRRVLHIVLILALLFGLPLNACLIAGNVVWAALLVTALATLSRAGGLAVGAPNALIITLAAFLRVNRRDLLWSAGYIGSEFYSYTYPPLLIPLVYGLGPTAIAFDTAYKVFRGANVLLAATCEVAAPWQTRAYAERSRRGMLSATAAAALLSFFPALGVCAVLLLAGDRLFAFLLGGAGTVPRELTILIAALVAANWLQTMANVPLVCTGFFAAVARVALVMAALLSVPALYGILLRPAIVSFTAAYTAIYAAGAIAYLALAIRLPLRVGETAREAMAMRAGTS